MTRLVLALCWLACVLWPRAALAHGGEPVGLLLVERGDAALEFTLDVTLDHPLSSSVTLQLPRDCLPRGAAQRSGKADRVLSTQRHVCPRSLQGREVGLQGLSSQAPTALLRFQSADGDVTTLLSEARPSAVVPSTPRPLPSLLGHVRSGAEHLALGLDHVLFILGMAFIARDARRLVAVLGAFALGHAATLLLGALEVVRLPVRLVEVAIASTLVWLAVRIVRGEEPGHTTTAKGLAPAAFGFGLVHGLGFASGLRAAGLPRGDLPLALLGFNLGIELAQLAVVSLGVLALRACPARLRGVAWLQPATGFAVGCWAASWALEHALP